ncbi:acetate--CoA ligase family protein [Dactylosporangium sp. NPDC005572]|uniref:acetate--CoA ligase family protein n=1 Tax=Dactylosporangium sp. NPDC005572 TaxID=3156889 RepID=UPI0033BD67FE
MTVVVPEPEVKDFLRRLGVQVPKGTVGTDPAGLTPPLVLKAFGPDIVHKSDIGAVELGHDATTVAAAAARMRERIPSLAGFLVEEQLPIGLELIVGVVHRPPFGHLVLLGLGGTLAEVIDRTVTRLAPLTPAGAEEMIAAFPAAALLDGVRGGPPLDRAALAALLVAVSGPLLDHFGERLAEFECNPVALGPSGAVALDARLLLRDSSEPSPPEPAGTDFTPLFSPRAVAVAGASATKQGFGNRFLQAYRAAGWTDGTLFAIHPSADRIDGVPAVPSVADIPGGVDYLLVTVPAAQAPALVAGTAGAARFVQVVSGGFGETGAGGADRERELLGALRSAKTRLLGPNCLGTYAPRGRQVFTFGQSLEPGPVSVLSQSGGLAGDITTAGGRRGIRFARVVSLGNGIDVAAGELLEWLVDDPETGVVGCYLEGPRDGARLVRALRRSRKPVVLLPGGLSRQGADAVASHTGSLAGDDRLWDAIAAGTGAIRVSTLEDFLGVLRMLQVYAHRPAVAGSDVLVVGPGGGASVLATDACDRAGLTLAPIVEATRQALRDNGFGAGTSVANPVEVPIGPASPPDLAARVLGPVLAGQSYPDVLLHVNVQSYFSYGTGDLAPLVDLLGRLPELTGAARVTVAARNLDTAPGDAADRIGAAAVAAGVPLYGTLDAAATAIAAVKRWTGVHAMEGRNP